MKLFVVARSGRKIAGYGSRDYGEYFELPSDLAIELAARQDFSLDDPALPVKPENDVFEDDLEVGDA